MVDKALKGFNLIKLCTEILLKFQIKMKKF